MITVEIYIQATLSEVWEKWIAPKHIMNWNFASEEWCCPAAINEIKPGGQLNWRMEAKDKSVGFDFKGRYTDVIEHEKIAYTLEDGRKVIIIFREEGKAVHLTESFEAEGTNSDEMQRLGWQSILGNFKKYVENN